MSKSVKPLAQPEGVLGPSGVSSVPSGGQAIKASEANASIPHKSSFFIVKLLKQDNFAAHTGAY
jgi:hypothetical protein